MADWIEHEAGLMEESQGSFSPDILPDDAIVYSRQWWRKNADGTFTVVTYSASPTKEDAIPEGDEGRNDPPFEISDLLEWTICTDKEDPGSTELNTDMEYGDMNYATFESIDAANTYAKRKVKNIDVNRDIYIPE